MRTRQVRDESPVTVPEAVTAPETATVRGGALLPKDVLLREDALLPDDPVPPSREPVLIGDILFETLADLARRTTPSHPLRLPAQRPHP
ncbi:hypothetical protein ACFCX4_01355 [Kitasatospora sp. NPDC056327]|uniref:hypothetical protein n=1 Tax=Kitasatospora sp. NPDC056327 TaxID=3345785 RepID=UPI0035D75CDF